MPLWWFFNTFKIGWEDKVHVEIEDSKNPQTITNATKLFMFCCLCAKRVHYLWESDYRIKFYSNPPGSQFALNPLILQCNCGLQFAAAAKPVFESASWEEQEPPLTEELMKKTDDDTNWFSIDSSVNSSDDKITAAESDPWAQVEIKEAIHTGRAVDVQVQLMEGSRGGWPQRRPARLERPKFEPENQEVDNIVQSMRNILFNL